MSGIAFELDGVTAPTALTACLSEVEVRQSLNAPSLALLTFLDPPGEKMAGLAMGTRLALRAPDGDPLFNGEITAIRRSLTGSKTRSVTVRAYDALHRLRKRQSLRHMASVGLTDFASTAVSELGLNVVGGDGTPAPPLLIQHRQSDFDLLFELATTNGHCFWLHGDTLRLQSLGGVDGDEIRLAVDDNILEITTDVTAEPMRKSSHAFGWNVASNEVVSGEAGSSAQDALEMRMDALAAFEGLGNRYLVNRLFTSADEARQLAQGDIDRATARGLVVDALCEGDPQIHPGTVVRIEGVGSEADGPFVVSTAVHRFDGQSGYTTRIGTNAPPGGDPARACAAVTIGVVIDTNDPESKARIKARLPAFGDVEGDWMPVLSIGAGSTKGFSIIPEPDDEVFVLMPDGNPARGIVLGGLYGANSAPGERPPDGARSFVIRSPSGPQITLDGCKSLMRLESGDGETFEIGPEGTLLRAARDLTIEAPGRTIKIRAKRVDFETA